MRTACDLKLESVNRNNTFRNTYKKSNYLTTLVFSIDRLFFKDKLAAFKSLKKMYS